MGPILNKAAVFLLFILAGADLQQCPRKCSCKRWAQMDGSDFIKLRCGETDRIASLDEIDLLNIASQVVYFNLSDNSLSTFNPKVLMTAVQKLDLSINQLVQLQNNQFAVFPNLRRLDLSGNMIKSIEVSAFAELEKLERLRLNQNKISSFEMSVLIPLLRLAQLDISNNPLTCDCGLLWLLSWSQKNSVKLVSNPKCNSPSTFKGLPLRKLKVGVDIHCKSSAGNKGFPIIEMRPNTNQVVFEGDALKLQCKAPSIADVYDPASGSKIEWTWLDSDPKEYFADDITIDSQFLESTGLIDSTLRISKLKRNHTGIWNCLLNSMQGNHSKGITIVVISDDTQYCPITSTSGNKGSYVWPRTVVNYTVTIPCESPNLNYDVLLQRASYFCTEEGQWDNLNTSMCSYISETTKILEQFSKVNSSIIESAKHFKNYTMDPKHFQDVMDMVFAVETIENYLKYLSVNQIGSVLMDVTNNLLELPKEYLRTADLAHNSCAKLLNVTEKLAGMTSTSILHKNNMALEIFPVKKLGFSGLKCTWYVDEEKQTDRLFYCATTSQTDSSDLRGKFTEASVTIPDTLFQQLEHDQDYYLANTMYNIFISMYSNSKLFPIRDESAGKEEVTSAVVGAKLVDISVTNLSDPVFVMLKLPPKTPPDASFTPVWWNARLRNGTGAWSRDGCHFSHEYQDHVVFFCHQFGHYGLLQNVTDDASPQTGAKFKLSHPAVYVGTFILFTSLVVVIVTYLLCCPSIQMPKKAKHSLINMWMAICCLCFMYAFGVYQTEDQKVCQIVGMSLHYFTLASLLWMCVGVNCMYKRLSKNDIMGSLQDDELPSTDQPIRKPVLGLYFVGWGVAIIICGISAAINIKDYASPTYCFLRPGPPLSALYIPVALLVALLVILFLLIRCTIYNMDANGHLSEGTQATEHVDLDLLEPNFSADVASVHSASSKTASSEVEDPEHAPSAQLKAYVIFLCIYGLAWLSCAFATTEPYNFVSFEEDLFSIAYAVLATILSAFTLFFYCVARSDVRTQWVVLSRWMRRRKSCFRTRNVSDATRTVPEIQIQALQPGSGMAGGGTINMAEMQVVSRSSSRSSSRTKSSINGMKAAAVDLNAPSYSNDPHLTKINNMNLIVMHRQQYRSSVLPNIIDNPTNVAEVFYNPHQSIVARKFFKRQKRHMMKRNNLVPRPTVCHSDSGSVVGEATKQQNNSSIDQSIFGTNSKVNNTNIHSKHVHNTRRQQRNLNVFSDSGDEYESHQRGHTTASAANEASVRNIVMNAERMRKHKTRKKPNSTSNTCTTLSKAQPESQHENNMRSVSQQCTLEYSSENISDSILDKGSPVLSPIKTEEAPLANPCGQPLTEIFVDVVPPASSIPAQPGSTASSVAASDLDELYQRIRKAPASAGISPNGSSLARNSAYFSDSDIHLYRNRDDSRRQVYNVSSEDLFDNLESTV